MGLKCKTYDGRFNGARTEALASDWTLDHIPVHVATLWLDNCGLMQAELTVSASASLSTLDCPANFSSLATLSSAPSSVLSFGVINPVGGASFPFCP